MTFIVLIAVSFFFLIPKSGVTAPLTETPALEEVQATTTPEVIPVVKPIVPLKEGVALELVERLGSNHPLIAVAKCESGLRQFNQDGSVLRGVQNSQDVGVLQINEHYHLADSKRLGYDIHTLEGNIDYGEYLYDHQGLTPWNWSKDCWSKYI